MDYSPVDVTTYLFLFDLPHADKSLLAKFEGFTSVESWEQDKQSKLDWLSKNKDSVTYNIFDKLSFDDNREVGKHVSLTELEQVASPIIDAISINDDFNSIQMKTLVTVWALKNKPECFNL